MIAVVVTVDFVADEQRVDELERLRLDALRGDEVCEDVKGVGRGVVREGVDEAVKVSAAAVFLKVVKVIEHGIDSHGRCAFWSFAPGRGQSVLCGQTPVTSRSETSPRPPNPRVPAVAIGRPIPAARFCAVSRATKVACPPAGTSRSRSGHGVRQTSGCAGRGGSIRRCCARGGRPLPPDRTTAHDSVRPLSTTRAGPSLRRRGRPSPA